MDAKTVDARTHEFDVQDVEYLRHGDKPLLARVFKPRGEGPFPALVDLHGGAWCMSDRTTEQRAPRGAGGARRRRRSSLDFRRRQRGRLSGVGRRHQLRGPLGQAERQGAQDAARISSASPASRAAAIWRCSSAMRPHDPRYTAIPLPAGSPALDATVKCVVMSWPVINPLGRYRFAKRQRGAAQSAGLAAGHHRRATTSIWGSEANMAEGNPMLDARARREGRAAAGDLVPGPRRHAARLQGRGLQAPGTEAPRFVANYRKAGGEIELSYFDSDRKPGHSPDLTQDRRHLRADARRSSAST